MSSDGRPNNGEATRLGGEHVNLIGALSHITEEALNGIGGLNVPVHALRELVKGHEVLFVLSQAAYGFGIAHSVLGECSLPVGSTPLVCSVAPKCQRVQLEPLPALVWGWHS